jgi:hypothetical protein
MLYNNILSTAFIRNTQLNHASFGRAFSIASTKKIVFLGSPDVAAETLEFLHNNAVRLEYLLRYRYYYSYIMLLM